MDNITTLQSAFSNVADRTLFTWLHGRTYSEAFVICIGAGPWKYGRRKTIQQMALDKLNGREIDKLPLKNVDWFPLNWQNQFLTRLIKVLDFKKMSMTQYCSMIKRIAQTHPVDALEEFYWATSENKKGTKVLSLFCRDALMIPSFPIDRHVKRRLVELKLPTNEFKLIQLCNKAELDPRVVATAFVKDAGKVDNPDWSIYRP